MVKTRSICLQYRPQTWLAKGIYWPGAFTPPKDNDAQQFLIACLEEGAYRRTYGDADESLGCFSVLFLKVYFPQWFFNWINIFHNEENMIQCIVNTDKNVRSSEWEKSWKKTLWKLLLTIVEVIIKVKQKNCFQAESFLTTFFWNNSCWHLIRSICLKMAFKLFGA